MRPSANSGLDGSAFPGVRRCALVLGHPGHELRIFQTVARLAPRAYLLTDGSGATGCPRTASTVRALAAAGTRLAAPFPPPIPDAVLYDALLSGHHRVLLDWARTLADDFRLHRVQIVVADAAEGFNPAHDVCRAVARAARQAAGVEHGYAYLLEGRPDACPPGRERGAIATLGTPEDSARKQAAIEEYPEIQSEVTRAQMAWGRAAFTTEWIFRDDAPIDAPPDDIPPAYERFGESRVQAGKYAAVIRYEAHVRPFLAALESEFGA